MALWWGTGLYDLVDSYFAVERHNRREEALRGVAPAATEPPALIRF